MTQSVIAARTERMRLPGALLAVIDCEAIQNFSLCKRAA